MTGIGAAEQAELRTSTGGSTEAVKAAGQAEEVTLALIEDDTGGVKATEPEGVESQTSTNEGQSTKPWQNIPDLGYDREMLTLWHHEYTAREIGDRLGKSPKTILNRVCELRKEHGKEVVPLRRTETQKRPG